MFQALRQGKCCINRTATIILVFVTATITVTIIRSHIFISWIIRTATRIFAVCKDLYEGSMGEILTMVEGVGVWSRWGDFRFHDLKEPESFSISLSSCLSPLLLFLFYSFWQHCENSAGVAATPMSWRFQNPRLETTWASLHLTVFGKHCECIAQKCTHLERLPPLASHLLLLSHCVLTRHGGKKINHIRFRRESNLDLIDFRLLYLTSILLEQSYPMGRTVSANK